jgi:hypothetical protein
MRRPAERAAWLGGFLLWFSCTRRASTAPARAVFERGRLLTLNSTEMRRHGGKAVPFRALPRIGPLLSGPIIWRHHHEYRIGP